MSLSSWNIYNITVTQKKPQIKPCPSFESYQKKNLHPLTFFFPLFSYLERNPSKRLEANMHRRLLETELSVSPPTASGNRTHDSFVNEANFDTNMVIILAALLCALICALGLNSIVRCALRCSHRLAIETPEQAAARLAVTGLKKRDLRRIPVAVYGEGVDIPATECPICLGEFVDGEKVRVLPKCNHGFHVRCIDTWLLSHSSCPNCRHSLLNNNERSTASSSAAEEPAGVPAPGNDAAEQTTVVVVSSC